MKKRNSTDKTIFHCKNCKDCWEVKTIRDRKNIFPNEIIYYKNFVTYGKEKRICPPCNGIEGWLIAQPK